VNGDEVVEDSTALPRQPAIILTDAEAGGTMTGDEVGAESLARFGVDMNASFTRAQTFTSTLSTAASNVSIISDT